MNWAGISNENEFYSDHYVAEVFAKHIQPLLDTWLDAEQSARQEATTGAVLDDSLRTPYNRLNPLARDAVQLQRDFERRRDVLARLTLARDWSDLLIDRFGYQQKAQTKILSEDLVVPMLAEVNDVNGDPLLWILEALPLEESDKDPLAESIHESQISGVDQSLTLPKAMRDKTWQAVISQEIFTLEAPPRWVILASPFQWLLLERGKFAQNRLLRFDWLEILNRRESDTLKATAVLLHQDALLVDQGPCLLDELDEKSHNHAYGVSEDLKYALRECIELLGNEAASQLIARARDRKEGVFSGKNELDPDQLSKECLRYMYRVLFLFYIEARPELGYAPLNSEVYLQGYSLESLRQLEMVELTSPVERNGRFIHDTLTTLFKLIDQGFQKPSQQVLHADSDAFEIAPLKSHLFDPARTAMLNTVVFPNHLLLRVIRLMSLSREGSRRRRGRISYAQLGINQLGAVYEALLSFRGFFATEDLYEVKKAKEQSDPLNPAYFVNARALKEYKEDEKVFDKDEAGHKVLRKYEKGAYIYRMAGRDRQKSASYYTPEVLTQCLVKYALQELYREQLDPLPDDAARAKRVLELTVCEPAMGSAAFLNEAVNQLAEKYLELTQGARGERIPQSEYVAERQKVKMYLADRNVFGVDLNPIAVELAEVSIWLNALSEDRFVPWLGLQLHCGNSLIGARREYYAPGQLVLAASEEDSWLKTPPRSLPMNQPSEDGIWHFLLPFRGMAAYDERIIKERYKPQIDAIKKWRNQFIKPFDPDDVARLQTLSEKVEALWLEHARQLAELRDKTTDQYNVYGQEDTAHGTTSLAFKDNALSGELLAEQLANASSWRRLKLVMDYWCALWFWPIDQYQLLPSREEWLFDLENLLLGDTITASPASNQSDLFAPTVSEEDAKQFVDQFGVVNLDVLFQSSARFRLADQIGNKQRFFHWPLEFADIFKDQGGFDLVVGNPPWIKIEWDEADVLGDVEPVFVLKKMSTSRVQNAREETFVRYEGAEDRWRSENESIEGTQSYLKALVNYFELSGQKANLYKCFLPLSWRISNEKGTIGFLHPEGVFEEPQGGHLRQEIYSRLRWHFQFQNQRMLFPIGHRTRFSICVYQGASSKEVCFRTIANLFRPHTISSSLTEVAAKDVGGIKTDDGSDWNEEGHPERVIYVDRDQLAMYAKLYDEKGTPAIQARLPAIHARGLNSILTKFSNLKARLGDLEGSQVFFNATHWNEKTAQDNGTIQKVTDFPGSMDRLVMSGPHFYIGNPFYKTPRRVCTEKSHYDTLDLSILPDEFVPRTNFVPACTRQIWLQRVPKLPWVSAGDASRDAFTNYYRLVVSRGLGPSGERTLQPAIAAKGITHIDGVFSATFKSDEVLVRTAGLWSSLLFDYFVRSTGREDFRNDLAKRMGMLDFQRLSESLLVRVLALNTLSQSYAELWSGCWNPNFRSQNWSCERVAINVDYFGELSEIWQRSNALRLDFERRQALLEIDVIVSMALRVTLSEIIGLYKMQFPVMRRYEDETFYDHNGRIIFTPSKGLIGVGLPRKARKTELSEGTSYGVRVGDRTDSGLALGWEDVRDLKEGVVIKTFRDDTLPDGPRERTIEYVAPFFRPNREEDYRVAWKFFEKELGKVS
jgi:hypothetical protein